MSKSVLTSEPLKGTPKLNWFMIIFLSLSLAGLISLAFLGLTAGVIGFVAYNRIQPELTSRNLALQPAISEVKLGWSQQPILEKDQQNWLILGVDSLESRGNVPPLTDTMLLAGVRPKSASVNLLSLPRDLWLDDVKTKINSLYAYGIDQNPAQPTQLVTQTLSRNLALPIHKTLIVTLTQLEQVIDILGGVEIDVPVGFTDTLFPRPDVDVKTVRDPKLLYETITFTPGSQKMSGSLALKYIRSRHSGDLAGTDLARGDRQQLVVESLIKQLADVTLYKQNPVIILDLWEWYQLNFQSQIGIAELVSLFKPMIQAKQFKPMIIKEQLTVAKMDKWTGQFIEPGVIYNPVVKSSQYLGQWVYLPTDTKKFQNYIYQKIYQ